MHDPVLVCGLDGIDQLAGDGHNLVEGQSRPRRCGGGLARQTLGQRFTLDQLEHQGLDGRTRGCAAVVRDDSVDRPDVGVVERGQHARLAFEASTTLLVRQPRAGQDLEPDVAAKREIASPVRAPHATGSEERAYLVVSQTIPG